MGRQVPWRNRCPPEIQQLLSEVSTCGLLVMQQPGPTMFVLKDPSTNKKVKVCIGEEHRCNCRSSGAPAQELCLHILFVLSRVFRLPADNPLVWQRSLLAAEVEQLIRGHVSQNARRRGTTVGGGADGGSGTGSSRDGQTVVQRRPVQPDDTCPICCDDITEDARALVWCRFGCGNSIHATCFRQYATHNSTNPAPLTCPLCREPWGVLGEGPLHNVSCSDCHGPIHGERYKCAFCASYNLCASCFQCPTIHAQHPFDMSCGPGMPFQPAARPVATRAAPESAAQAATDAVHPLMLRDLGPEDYESLLQLDAENAPAAGARLLTMDQAATLRTATWTRVNPDMEACDTCAICMEAFAEGSQVQLLPLCRHVFHINCAVRWLTECRGVCPIDNTPVVVVPRGVAGQGASERQRRRQPNAHPGAPANATSGSSARAPPARLVPRHRFEDARAEIRSELNRRNPNTTISGYCPSAQDLNALVVGTMHGDSSVGPLVTGARSVGGGNSGNHIPGVLQNTLHRPRRVLPATTTRRTTQAR